MKVSSYLLCFILLCLSWSCNKSFDPDRKGMEQLHKVLEDKFGATAWYSSITLVHDAAGDDMVTIERSVDPGQARQEQWTWFHGFWEKKANIELQYSGLKPRDLLFQLQGGNQLQQLGRLVEQSLQELGANPANGRCKLVMAGITVDDYPSPEGQQQLCYTIQLKSAAGVNYNYRYNERGEKLPPGNP